MGFAGGVVNGGFSLGERCGHDDVFGCGDTRFVEQQIRAGKFATAQLNRVAGLRPCRACAQFDMDGMFAGARIERPRDPAGKRPPVPPRAIVVAPARRLCTRGANYATTVSSW